MAQSNKKSFEFSLSNRFQLFVFRFLKHKFLKQASASTFVAFFTRSSSEEENTYSVMIRVTHYLISFLQMHRLFGAQQLSTEPTFLNGAEIVYGEMNKLDLFNLT